MNGIDQLHMPARRAILALLVLAAGASSAFAAEYTIQPGGASFVQFVSKAPMETVTGKTRDISGRIGVDPAGLGDSIDVSVEVDLASLDTGNALRNKHMRENHLQTDKYPKAVFLGGKISDLSQAKIETGKTTTLKVAGDFELHGVHRRIEAPAEATLLPDGALHAVIRFDLKLSDFGIPRPQFLVMRLDEVQHITLDVTARPDTGK